MNFIYKRTTSASLPRNEVWNMVALKSRYPRASLGEPIKLPLILRRLRLQCTGLTHRMEWPISSVLALKNLRIWDFHESCARTEKGFRGWNRVTGSHVRSQSLAPSQSNSTLFVFLLEQNTQRWAEMSMYNPTSSCKRLNKTDFYNKTLLYAMHLATINSKSSFSTGSLEVWHSRSPKLGKWLGKGLGSMDRQGTSVPHGFYSNSRRDWDPAQQPQRSQSCIHHRWKVGQTLGSKIYH